MSTLGPISNKRTCRHKKHCWVALTFLKSRQINEWVHLMKIFWTWINLKYKILLNVFWLVAKLSHPSSSNFIVSCWMFWNILTSLLVSSLRNLRNPCRMMTVGLQCTVGEYRGVTWSYLNTSMCEDIGSGYWYWLLKLNINRPMTSCCWHQAGKLRNRYEEKWGMIPALAHCAV